MSLDDEGIIISGYGVALQLLEARTHGFEELLQLFCSLIGASFVHHGAEQSFYSLFL